MFMSRSWKKKNVPTHELQKALYNMCPVKRDLAVSNLKKDNRKGNNYISVCHCKHKICASGAVDLIAQHIHTLVLLPVQLTHECLRILKCPYLIRINPLHLQSNYPHSHTDRHNQSPYSHTGYYCTCQCTSNMPSCSSSTRPCMLSCMYRRAVPAGPLLEPV